MATLYDAAIAYDAAIPYDGAADETTSPTAAKPARRRGSSAPLLHPQRTLTGGLVLPALTVTGSLTVVEDEGWLLGLTPFVL